MRQGQIVRSCCWSWRLRPERTFCSLKPRLCSVCFYSTSVTGQPTVQHSTDHSSTHSSRLDSAPLVRAVVRASVSERSEDRQPVPYQYPATRYPTKREYSHPKETHPVPALRSREGDGTQSLWTRLPLGLDQQPDRAPNPPWRGGRVRRARPQQHRKISITMSATRRRTFNATEDESGSDSEPVEALDGDRQSDA